MAEDSEVVAGEVVFSSDLFQVNSNQVEELFRRIGFFLDRVTELGGEGSTRKSLSFSPVPYNGKGGNLIQGRVHLIWEVEDKDEIGEAVRHLHNLGFI